MPSANHGETGVPLTVAKIESGMAIVLTEDLELLELPLSLFPTGITPNKMVRMNVAAAVDLADKRRQELLSLQEKILHNFGTPPDASVIAKCLKIRNVTHTTILVGWPAWREELSSNSGATIEAIDGFINGRRISATISADETSLKLTGLEPNKQYEIKLAFRTSCGRFQTNSIAVNTRPLEDLTCLNVMIDVVDDETVEMIQSLGMQISGALNSETSLVITSQSKTQLETRDSDLLVNTSKANIPIVNADWVKACKEAGRMQSVCHFYCQ